MKTRNKIIIYNNNREIEADIIKSPVKDKKLRAIFNYKGKLRKIDFGDIDYEHYYDKTGLYKDKNHNNKYRQKNYLKRSMNIKADNKPTYNDPLSPNYWSINILW